MPALPWQHAVDLPSRLSIAPGAVALTRKRLKAPVLDTPNFRLDTHSSDRSLCPFALDALPKKTEQSLNTIAS